MDEFEMEQMHDGIDTILAENDRLRADVERLRDLLAVRIQHGHNLRTMLESATDTERAAVVEYLRAPGTSCDLNVLADAFERGEHLEKT